MNVADRCSGRTGEELAPVAPQQKGTTLNNKQTFVLWLSADARAGAEARGSYVDNKEPGSAAEETGFRWSSCREKQRPH